MIRITKQSDYGILLLAHLAKRGSAGEQLSARDLAEQAHLPQPMVSKILQLLVHRGLVTSQRGVNGGYQLARPPHAISVAEIIDAVEGPIAVTECIETAPGHCELEACCMLRDIWQRINNRVRIALEDVTLAEMVSPTLGSSGFDLLAVSAAMDGAAMPPVREEVQ